MKKVIIVISFVVLAFVLSNWEYIWQNISYVLNKPEILVLEDQEQGESNKLVIPSIRVNAPIVYVEERDEKVFQEALAKGVVHYPNTANPGQPGNAYFFGHSSDYAWVKSDYKTVFGLLPRLELGQEIVITDKEGKLFRYEVFEKKIISPNDLSVLGQDPNQSILTLQTSYPIGTALKRYLVLARLKSN
jgi:LPXTG-site transpeptidase (sortase) family protein